LRLLARQRCGIARLRAQTKNRVNSLLEMQGLRPQRCVFTAKGRAWIQKQALSQAAQLCFERFFRLHDFLTEERKTSEAELETAAAAFPEVALLRTIPGLGHMLAAVVWSEIGDLARFDSADALLNYTGLVPPSPAARVRWDSATGTCGAATSCPMWPRRQWRVQWPAALMEF
jgi:transposase